MHFPQNYDRKYYNMLTAEDKVREVKNGVVKIKWDAKSRRNEALDCRVGNLALRNAVRELINDELVGMGEIEEKERVSWDDFWVVMENREG